MPLFRQVDRFRLAETGALLRRGTEVCALGLGGNAAGNSVSSVSNLLRSFFDSAAISSNGPTT